MSRPLVAVAPARFGPGQIGHWTDSGEAVQTVYLAALRRAGAVPVALGGPDDFDPEELLDPFDGLVLLGGADVDPAFYGQSVHPSTYGVDARRDRYEIELALAALRIELPLFAVCRGEQVLNVALGGTLWQHLPDLGLGEIAHGVPFGGVGVPATHPVTIEPASRLAALAGGARELAACTSIHHQAVHDLGEGLVVTARSADGVVEAVEPPLSRRGWCVGVQWHPERTAAVDPAQQSLFDGFVAVCASASLAARRRRAG